MTWIVCVDGRSLERTGRLTVLQFLSVLLARDGLDFELKRPPNSMFGRSGSIRRHCQICSGKEKPEPTVRIESRPTREIPDFLL